MFTIGYKGHYIHGYFDRDACKVQLVVAGVTRLSRTVKSLHAAKCLITRMGA